MKILSYLFWLCVVPVALADVTISNVKVEPVMPWGKACITYEVNGTLPERAKEACLCISLSNAVTHVRTQAMDDSVSGDKLLTIGVHRLVWDLAKDNISTSELCADFRIEYTLPPPLYLVIDLSSGASASSYPVTYLFDVPDGGWTDKYKTEKLVLRRIDAGTFIMGEPLSPSAFIDDGSEEEHRVTLTKSFYIGIFEITQRQWELVMGTRPSHFTYHEVYPVESVSYHMIRGESTNNQVDSKSFIGRLREKTGLEIDLPTEAQWEYSCRAGTTSRFSYGYSADDKYMWYCASSTSVNSTSAVGVRLPNDWGLYDMHGNVFEWCLDWYGSLEYGTDPIGPLTFGNTESRVIRGGSYLGMEKNCTSYYRYLRRPDATQRCDGFRIVRKFH